MKKTGRIFEISSLKTRFLAGKYKNTNRTKIYALSVCETAKEGVLNGV